MPAKRKKNIKLTNRQKKLIKIGLYGTGIIILLIILFITSVHIGVFGKIPTPDDLAEIRQHQASQIYTSDNILLGRYYIQNRTNVSFDRIPETFIHALVSTEDARFYEHNGIDRRSMLRVFFKSILLQKKSSGGGSTITQQLAKNLYPRKYYWKFTVPVAKLKEITIAKRLEKIYTKNEILELYLNTVPFGQGTFGIETASITYFNKKPEDLKVEESAMLVGLLKATTYYNPKNNEEKAVIRRNIVLQQMNRYGYLTEEECDSLKKTPLNLNMRILDNNEGLAPYFREYVRLQLLEMLDTLKKADGTKYNLYTDGLKIYSTIDYRMQKFAEQAVEVHLPKLQILFDKQWEGVKKWNIEHPAILALVEKTPRYIQLKREGLNQAEIIKELSKPVEMRIYTWEGEKDVMLSPIDSIIHHIKLLQVGFIAMDVHNGNIKAWIGGINHRYYKYDHVLSKRQAGSTFKPLIYAKALENGITPCQFFANDSISYPEYDNWTPRNADRRYGGSYSVKGALTHSVNTVSVQLLMQNGIENTIEFAHKAGIQSEMPEVPSLALGSGEMSLLELTSAYSVFNTGKKLIPNFIMRVEDKNGKILFSHKYKENPDTVISAQTVQYMTAMLQGVIDHGTGASARTVYGLKGDFAGKTGTTQNQTDGWFIGYSPDIVAGTWVGGDIPSVRFRSLYYGQGSFSALPVWVGFMKRVYENPNFKHLAIHKFKIDESITDELTCEDYRESDMDNLFDFLEQQGLSVKSYIEHIFKNKNESKRKKRNKNRNR